jgi:ElaB/YqjD/DUF883 family membrane-anchored ribosome-binding protein
MDDICKLLDDICKLLDDICKLLDDICKLLDDICKLLDDICKLLDDICNDQRYKDTKAFNTNRRRNGNTTEQKIKDQKKEDTAIQLNRR